MYEFTYYRLRNTPILVAIPEDCPPSLSSFNETVVYMPNLADDRVLAILEAREKV